ncbi:hypothetical protein BGZ60DRAFT_428335 [Tricladium varicosporioides]|nr:hypothetical protein BGZ60DRAFT_428335 [Hymenoscyphus varicosporioides]
MRLLHTRTYELCEFVENEANKVEYAILSHTWDRDEVTFQDMRSWVVRYTRKLGWKKINYCCQQARQDGIEWIWVDTVCIDKSSSAELSEAINSMFAWYRDAKVCYAYLADISAARWSARDHYSCLQDSRWFSRGWTLQELLAPQRMILYGTDWNQLGTRDELSDLISKVSGIQVSVLRGNEDEINNFSIAQRMCWASKRETTRSEDIAYCLLGLFDVNMPLLYGEGGKKAFIRLQEEIMKNSDDHTLFAWNVPREIEDHKREIGEVGLLAEHPVFFRSSKDILSFRRWDVSDTFSMTNKGLRITVPLAVDTNSQDNWIAYLDCHQLKGDQRCAIGIPLKQLSKDGDQFARVAQAIIDIPLSLEHEVKTQKRAIYIRKEIIKPDEAFKRDIYRLRGFRVLQTPSTHDFVDRYGSARESSDLRELLAPPKTTSYWIDSLEWANWHVVCLFEEKESVYRARTSSFIIVLGYDGDAAKAWCAIEPYNDQSLHDVWDEVRRGKYDFASKVLLQGRSVVRVNVQPAKSDSGVVEVYVDCNYGLEEINDDGTLRDMDPLSIFSGTDGVADICIQLVKYLEDMCGPTSNFRQSGLHEFRESIPVLTALDEGIHAFIKIVKALGAANKAIQVVFHQEILKSRSSVPEQFWKHVAGILQNCRKAVKKLRFRLGDIYDAAPTENALDDLILNSNLVNIKAKNSETMELKQYLDNLSIYHEILHVSLLTINQYDNGDDDTIRLLEDLLREVRSKFPVTTTSNIFQRFGKGGDTNDTPHDLMRLTALNDLRKSIEAAVNVMNSETSNRYFYIPQAISPIFTGQSDLPAQLEESFFEASTTPQSNVQRRFVIYGIGGCGKTQLCCKFAHENRHRYWGVFWIDLSSPASTGSTCAQIAKAGGAEPTVGGAMHWLSNLKRRYLLILDNADDTTVLLDDYLPPGNKGHVIVTTRNPMQKIYGNVGCRYFELQGLNAEDANTLMLKAAEQPLPWDEHVESKASIITEALGFHPLAIIHAGSAVRNGLCTLDDYLAYYSYSMQRGARVRRTQRLGQPHEMYSSIFASFEIVYSDLTSKATISARDAVQLLKVFAFFHHENIQFDILERAIRNPAKEREHQEMEEEKARLKNLRGESRRRSWYMTLQNARRALVLAGITPPVLPDVIRDGQASNEMDPDRLRGALQELVQRSLIVHKDSRERDCYSMHPLAHRWARERPGVCLAEQALWSEAAANIVSDSLLLPPLGNGSDEELYNITVLPHVQHILACLESIRYRMSGSKRAERGPLWPSYQPPSMMSTTRAVRHMKFSFVLTHAGLFSEAELLQVIVKDHALKVLGIEHKTTRRIMLALANTYSNLGRFEQAENMLIRITEACETVLGSDDHETLLVKGALAETLFIQGRQSEARKLQKEVVKGLVDVKGRRHADTLIAIDNLGVTIRSLREDFREAQSLHCEAVEGLEEVLGPDHFRTLNAKENLSIVAIFIPGEDLKAATTVMDLILEKRRAMKGQENMSTQQAILNKAIIKCALNELDEAEELIRSMLLVVERNLGSNHYISIMGRYSLAKVLSKKKLWPEAEDILLHLHLHLGVSLSPLSIRHPNRLLVMKELFKCYRIQNKVQACLDLYNEVLAFCKMINKEGHPIIKEMVTAREKLIEEKVQIVHAFEGQE